MVANLDDVVASMVYLTVYSYVDRGHKLTHTEIEAFGYDYWFDVVSKNSMRLIAFHSVL